MELKAGNRVIKSYGMVISLLVHVSVLAIPLSTTVISVSGQGFRDVEISMIGSSGGTAANSLWKPARPVASARRVIVPKKKGVEPVKSGESPGVKIPRTESAEAADKELDEKPAEAETEILKPSAKEEVVEPVPREVAVSGDEVEALLQSSGPDNETDVLEGPVMTDEEDTIQSGLSTGNAYATEFGSTDGPGFLKRVPPRYPRLARRLGREGRVLLRLVIDEKGMLVEAEVLEKAGFGFEREALQAVRRSIFRPALRNGIPVRSEVLLPVRFVLKREG